MIKFTPEEISLCKKIKNLGVEFEPPDDWHGAYYVYHQDRVFPWADGEDKPGQAGEFVWLGEVSDCLEFLRERGFWIIGLQQDEDEFSFGYSETDELGMRTNEATHKWTDGNSVLEACLKAVLAVLEEKK